MSEFIIDPVDPEQAIHVESGRNAVIVYSVSADGAMTFDRHESPDDVAKKLRELGWDLDYD